jgi:hypothetical protein
MMLMITFLPSHPEAKRGSNCAVTWPWFVETGFTERELRRARPREGPMWMTSHRLVFAAFLLVGCGTWVRSIPVDHEIEAGGESVVIGRLTTDLGAEPIAFFDRMTRPSLSIENETTGGDFIVLTDKSSSDSAFYASLPPGEYLVTKVYRGRMESTLRARFHVPPGALVYVGTLKFSDASIAASIGASLLAGESTIPGEWSVEDRYDEAVAEFRELYPRLVNSVVDSLIELDHD